MIGQMPELPLLIRPEENRDHESICSVVRSAFAGHPHGISNEHEIVDALREAGALSLSLVAEQGHEVVGHVAFSRVTIDGTDIGWFGLGPVAVLPGWQHSGIGKRLIEAGLNALRQQGAAGCVVVGDPAYYRRFGFRANEGMTFDGVPPEYFMALSFGGAVATGRAEYHEAFSVPA